MASLGLSNDEIRSVEQTRRGLQQLSSSILSLKNELYRGNPLPTSASLQASASILQTNLSTLQRIIAENADLFQCIAVHPSTNYPGRTQEGILVQLLRKKPEPDVESWAEDGAAAAIAAGIDAAALMRGRGGRRSGIGEEEDDDDEEDDAYGDEAGISGAALDPLSETWADVREFCIERVEQFVKNESRDVYTTKERELGIENVRTGLRRNLEEDSEEEEDEEEEEDNGNDDDDGDLQMLDVQLGNAGASSKGAADGAVPPKPKPPLEQLLWLAARGDTQMPGNIELTQQTNATGTSSSAPFGR